MKFEQWLTQAKQNQHERIGQQFCNTYVRGSWPELFYADNDKAKTLIIEHLQSLHYWPDMPCPLSELKV